MDKTKFLDKTSVDQFWENEIKISTDSAELNNFLDRLISRILDLFQNVVWFEILDTEDSHCLNDNWELDTHGNCRPNPNKFKLTCSGDGMTVKMSKEVVPDAVGVTLLENCAGVFDSDGQGLAHL